MPFEPDPYRTLGLTRGATLDEVKRAYRRLAKANHPDAAGPAALSRFLAIQAAYDLLTGPSGGPQPGGRSGPAARPRPSAADPDRTEATRRTYKARPRAGASGSEPGASGTGSAGSAHAGRTRPAGPDGVRGTDPGRSNDDPPRTRAARGKATLGSTSYDGAEAGPFEPDWGGASWYGTTSGTYWTINPKEYADPRKHGPEYQARARRSTGARGVPPGASSEAGPEPVAPPTHTTASWWESTTGPETVGPRDAGPQDAADGQSDAGDGQTDAGAGPFDAGAAPDRRTGGFDRQRRDWVRRPPHGDDPAPDPTRAAIDLGRALTDPRSGGFRGRLVRAVLGWLPIAFGIGWLVGELTGCGRFAATCDPSVMPLTAAGQGIALVALLIVPEVAAVAAGAALFLLAAAVGASLILSATGAAADEGSRRAALGALLLVAWLSGLAIAVVRRFRSGSRSSRPVS
jgi:hypothetical protein